jgi:hypothetical protein
VLRVVDYPTVREAARDTNGPRKRGWRGSTPAGIGLAGAITRVLRLRPQRRCDEPEPAARVRCSRGLGTLKIRILFDCDTPKAKAGHQTGEDASDEVRKVGQDPARDFGHDVVRKSKEDSQRCHEQKG